MAFAYPTIGAEDTLWSKYIDEIKDIKFHPSGETIIISTVTQELIELDAATGNYIRRFLTDSVPVSNWFREAEISSDGQYLFGVDVSGQALIWEYSTGKFIRKINILAAHVKNIPNTNKFIVNKFQDQPNIWIYDAEQDSVLKAEKIIAEWFKINAIAVSPDAQYFAVSYAWYDNTKSIGSVSIYDLNAFEKVRDVVVDKETATFPALEFSKDGRWLAAYSYPTNIYDFTKLINEGIIDVKYSYISNYLSLHPNSEMIFQHTVETEDSTFLVRIIEKDTVLKFEFWSNDVLVQPLTNNLLINDAGRLRMLNSNWYTLSVPPIPLENQYIIEIHNANNSLCYSTFGIEFFNSFIITAATGAVVYSNSVIPLSGSIPLNLSSGVYFLSVNNEFTKKFVVVR